ncbi:MAG: gluconolaconase [Acidobacteria bacterium]|nr:gluconolaconase [Acidobacteriota bacterium]
METFEIRAVEPRVVLPGGVVRIAVERFDPTGEVAVTIGSSPAQVIGASSSLILARVPAVEGECAVSLNGRQEHSCTMYVGVPIVTGVNPVGNPAADKAGNIYVTFSGPRGSAVPFSVYRVLAGSGAKEPFLADIVNATGIAIGPDDMIYISSRHTGTVYKCDMQKNMEKFADNLGIATGLALDREGNLYVGDRSGTIHKLDPSGNDEVLCEIEPSVSAFHLAVRSDGTLLVSGPTLATQDNIYQVGPDRVPTVFFHGIGRPQGMALDLSGRLLVTGSYRGRRGVFAIEADSRVQQVAASPMLVGVLLRPGGELVLADSEALYQVPPGALLAGPTPAAR